MTDRLAPRPVQRVGVIGAGAMGMGVVQSLRRAGFEVHVRDIRVEAQEAAARLGAALADSPAALVRACDLAIILVVDAPQIETVLFAEDGAASALVSSSVVVISSTIAPDDVIGFAQRLSATGASVVDAPVSGGPQRAADGTMTIMAGGPSEALARCAPVFARIARRVFEVGALGDGAKFKLVNNLLAAANLAAGAEAFAIAREAGLDRRQVLDVVNASSGASWIVGDRLPRVLDSDYAPRAAARILAKDITLACDWAARLGIATPLADTVRSAFRDAVADGHGEEDDGAIVKWRAKRNRGV